MYLFFNWGSNKITGSYKKKSVYLTFYSYIQQAQTYRVMGSDQGANAVPLDPITTTQTNKLSTKFPTQWVTAKLLETYFYFNLIF